MITSGSVRARAAAGAAALLLVLVLLRHSPTELARRWVSLSRFAPRELAVRRLGGSGTAFDRGYFSFLEGARRRLPASAQGVAVIGVPEENPYLYLAAYQMAPRPVRLSATPLPEGWIIAAYGTHRPAGCRVLVQWNEGALLEPEP
ncbi:MAG: hypothetical protein ABI968_04530 [Acidobacteriota bacterium]